MNNNIIMIFERTGDTMCKILEKLRDKTPENLLKEYQISLVPPIDISLLMQRIGIKEIPFDFTELEKLMNLETGDIIGTVFAKNDELGIFYKASDSLNRQRFTIAHEIAHCCLDTDALKTKHIELRSSQTENTLKEYNANVFAGKLLIPKISLDKIHSKFLLAPPLSVISKIFEVSTTVMAARLDYLELKYIDDTN
ncbi:hypothetical protein C824_001468 [Schaedlerella arabinosiphila]|nr:hypothetical protein C824_001468 [Schaedlerella arabinosiphila]